MNVSKQQHKAICHGEGPMMVLAGPGAGKTFVITNRIKNLIEEYGVPPGDILVVTFSRGAATEMRERFDELSAHKYRGVWFGTFHSIFFKILKIAYHYSSNDIVTNNLRYRFIEEALNETDYDPPDTDDFLDELTKEISLVKGEGIDIDSYYSINCPQEVFRKVYKGYQNRLIRHRALDFDDMVVYTHALLKEREDIRTRWQGVFKYILIDEFQDINRLQYETIRMLAEPENNIFIVGDDDQSIYGFRGARPDIMLSFPKKYPMAEKVVLSDNFRSSSEIITSADRLIRNNKKRYKKNIKSAYGSAEGVHITGYADLSSEAAGITDGLKSYHDEGIDYEDMAVLFRTNIQMRSLAAKLMENAIPFSAHEGVPNMFATWIAKDILAYLRIAMGDDGRELFLKIANRPVRYISRQAFDSPHVVYANLRRYYMKKKQYWMIDRISEMEADIAHIKKLPPLSAIHYIRKRIGYDDFLKEYASDRGLKPDDWLDTLDEIQESASGYASTNEWIAYTISYGEELERMQKERKKDGFSQGMGVQLMTMHGSKGLEYEVVYIPTVNDGVSPYRAATSTSEIEEERRMLYVAMTRAKRHLHLSYVKKRYNHEAKPSGFLDEMGWKHDKRLR